MVVPEDDATVTGDPKAYLDNDTDSGSMMQRWFCGDCGWWVLGVVEALVWSLHIETILIRAIFQSGHVDNKFVPRHEK